MNGRPTDATIEALERCVAWLKACRELGWKGEDMNLLEDLWWRWHDKDGKKKKI